MVKRLQILKAKKGFTLVELIVVIAIIGVLAAILIPTMLGYVTSSRVTSVDTTAASLVDTVANAIVETDAAGHKVPRGTSDLAIDLTGDSNGAVTVDTTLAASYPELADAIQKKIDSDFKFTKAWNAVVVVNTGKVVGCAYTDDASPDLSTDTNFNVSTKFKLGKLNWGNDTPGIYGTNGYMIGTSPKLQLGS